MVGSSGFTKSFGSIEVDTLIGREGNDTFSLWGNTIRAGSLPNYLFNGNSDYALITEFNSNQDIIELLGEAGRGELKKGG